MGKPTMTIYHPNNSSIMFMQNTSQQTLGAK